MTGTLFEYARKDSNPQPSDPKPVREIDVREMGRDFGISCSTFCSTEEELWEKLSLAYLQKFIGWKRTSNLFAFAQLFEMTSSHTAQQ